MNNKKPKSSKVTTSILTKLAAKEAQLEGLLPHEWLNRIVQGHAVSQMIPHRLIDPDTNEQTIEWRESVIYPDLETRVECAKACAQFFAPKYNAIKATINQPQNQLSHMTESDIDEMLAELAGELDE